jgi:parvulin-like peptidyl-prolyl isomerase
VDATHTRALMNQAKPEKQPHEPKHHRSLGKTLTYVFTIVILVVVGVTFLGSPALSGVARSNRPVFGVYDGQEIMMSPGNYFSRTYQNVADYYQQSGIEITDQVYYSVWQTAYYEAVFHAALLSEAGNSGLSASSEAVDRAIAVWPEFQVDGRFSATEYQNMSAQNRLQLRDYLHEVLLASQVRSDIASTTNFSDDEIAFLAAMATPEHRFSYVQFGFDSFPDAEVVAYGEENEQRFGQISISQITVDSSQSDAQSIRQQAIDRTSSFEDLARNQSKDEFSADGGERGSVYYWDLEFDFEDVTLVDELFALAEGEISPVYETGTRWRIYKVNEAPIAPDYADPEIVTEVRNYLTTFERGLIEDYLRIEADKFKLAARANGFSAAAVTMDQQPQLTEYFPVNYGNVSFFPQVTSSSNAVISSSGAYREEFLQELFTLTPGDVSEPIVIRDYVMVFELDDVQELTEERITSLSAVLPRQIGQIVTTETNQEIVDEDLFVDSFNETYSRVVLGQ